MDLNILIANLLTSAPAKAGASGNNRSTVKRKILQEGVKPGDPASDSTVTVQQAIIASEPKQAGENEAKVLWTSYRTLAEDSGELKKAIGQPGPGMYGWQTAYAVRDRQIGRVFDALSKGDPSSKYNVRNADGTINQKKFDDAVKEYKREFMSKAKARKMYGGQIWDAMNQDLLDGTITGVNSNNNSWGGSATPSDKELLGKVANTKLSTITDVIPYDDRILMEAPSSRIVIEDALRIKVSSDQKIKVNVSTIIKDNGAREVVDQQDPAGGVINDVNIIVGGIRGFSVSLDPKNNSLTVLGKVDWEAGLFKKEGGQFKKEDAEAIYKSLTGRTDFESALVSEIEGGVIGYATIAVLKTVSGSGQVDLEVVRNKAIEAGNLQYPGNPVNIFYRPAQPVPPKTKDENSVPGGDVKIKSERSGEVKNVISNPVPQPAPALVPAPAPKPQVIAPAPIPAPKTYESEVNVWKNASKGLNAEGKIKLINKARQEKNATLIIGATFDPDPAVRWSACDALSDPSLKGRDAALQQLYSLAMYDPDGGVRVNAIAAYDSMMRNVNPDALIHFLNLIIDKADLSSAADRSAVSEARKRLGSLNGK